MVLRENSFALDTPCFLSPNTKLFRHLKQKLPFKKNSDKKAKIHHWNKPKLYCKAPVSSYTGTTENILFLNKRLDELIECS